MAGDTTQDAAATPRAGSLSSAAAGAAAGTRAALADAADAATDTSPASVTNPQLRESGEFGPGRKQDGGGPG
jgi:hypothetical protein